MSKFIRKRHNVSTLLYHFVCAAKYRRAVLTDQVETTLRDVCLEISQTYEIAFIEIGTDKTHVHFLVQSVPVESPTALMRTIKSITARELFARLPTLRKQLWGGTFWSSGYFVDTVGRHGNERAIRRYVREQGREQEYAVLHAQQTVLFE